MRVQNGLNRKGQQFTLIKSYKPTGSICHREGFHSLNYKGTWLTSHSRSFCETFIGTCFYSFWAYFEDFETSREYNGSDRRINIFTSYFKVPTGRITSPSGCLQTRHNLILNKGLLSDFVVAADRSIEMFPCKLWGYLTIV